ncbi:hypothetical protein TraAM80_05667 [Trypanosoma rangeli]|uniref:Uncharacterized protein n=1 Tax=Trypanosoma rangeli TaxID=5698 RepID=A0A422NDR5_TRYRA|nr:uncharacterized protein TraAM80_05667 [Trypanosoma rangeli]RNF03625.1 hypothetical protein TraAM80_05667 [Trypanosoma rangeli]|eukprot:RNF03625.1 hypothetical protein TraAM80_05667 [Trypanosoma rangeli]
MGTPESAARCQPSPATPPLCGWVGQQPASASARKDVRTQRRAQGKGAVEEAHRRAPEVFEHKQGRGNAGGAGTHHRSGEESEVATGGGHQARQSGRHPQSKCVCHHRQHRSVSNDQRKTKSNVPETQVPAGGADDGATRVALACESSSCSLLHTAGAPCTFATVMCGWAFLHGHSHSIAVHSRLTQRTSA